ncbi:MAG: hypothetical protein GY948_08175 [Alphaproteobacteria bacterium]|nr:hypothetical protein [Alphaproteobacteria bacterium]
MAPKIERNGDDVLQLAIELFLLVFATTVVGFAAGFGCGKLRGVLGAKQTAELDGEENHVPLKEESFISEPAPTRRIPDPAPPSQTRRKRFAADVSADPS